MSEYPALDVQAPDVMGSLNNVIGLQSKKLALQKQAQDIQTGQYLQQTAQADAAQAQQRNRELSAVAGLLKNPEKYRTADGGFDDKAMSDDVARVAPVYGQSVRTQALSAAGEALTNRTTAQNLTNQQRTSIAGTMSALASKPDVSMTDIINAGDQLIDQNPDPQFRRLVLSTLAHLPQGASPQQLQQSLSVMAGSMSGQSPIEQATNAASQNVVRDKNTGQLRAPTYAGGTQQSLNPTAASVAAANTTAAGTAGDDNARAKQISDSVAPSRQAITLTDQITNLADQVKTGKYSKAIVDYQAAAGLKSPEIAARQLMSKYAAQLKTVATTNAPTDSARAQIDAGFPDPDTMSPDAIRGAGEFIKGNMLMNLSRAANARRYATTHNGSTQGLRLADDQLTQNADPLMYTYRNLPNDAARTEFAARHFKSRDEARDFVSRMKLVEHNGGFEQ